jgi:hypothetical protein
MRSDHEIERLVEDWLEDEARPMPHDVLEGALEAIARTPQAGVRGLFGRQRSGLVGILVATGVLALAVLAGGLAINRIGSLLSTASESPGSEQVWDPTADWRSAPNQENPSPDRYGNAGVWRYMRGTSTGHDPVRYILMPKFQRDLPGFLGEAWSEPAMINVFVARLVADPSTYLHPTSGVYAILAWRSPVAGEVRIEGVVARPQNPCDEPSHGLLFSVDRGSETLRTLSLDLGQSTDFNLNTMVGIGDTVYFVVDADGDANCDLAQLRLTVTLQ